MQQTCLNFKHVCCIDSDLSDFHEMVCFLTKFNAPRHINKVIAYKSKQNELQMTL